MALLRENGISIAATAPARFKAGRLTLPVSGGEVDPTIDKGTIYQTGGFSFVAAKRKVILRDLMLKIKRAPLYAKVGGGQLKLAAGAETEVIRDGFGTAFTATKLRLTAKFATRLNKKLGLRSHPIKPGLELGTLTSKPRPTTVAVLGQGKATLLPSPGLLARLHELHVSLNPIAPAELAPGPLFSLPLLGGSRIAPDGRSGTVRTGGSLEFLQLGAGQVFWHELWPQLDGGDVLAEVDVEPTPTFPGKLGQLPATTLDLSAAAISSNPKARTVTVSGAQLALQPQSAATFNQAFAEGKEVFKPGDPLGTVSFTAQGQ